MSKFLQKEKGVENQTQGAETKSLRRREMMRFSAQMKNVALDRTGLHPG